MTETKRAIDQYEPDEMAIPTWKLIQSVGSGYARDMGA